MGVRCCDWVSVRSASHGAHDGARPRRRLCRAGRLDERRLAEVAAKLPPGKVEMLPLDATDDEALVRALVGVDLASTP